MLVCLIVNCVWIFIIHIYIYIGEESNLVFLHIEFVHVKKFLNFVAQPTKLAGIQWVL